MQDFLIGHSSKLPLPNLEADDTIFEYLVNEKGQWEHWSNRVCICINHHTCKPDRHRTFI